jgi:hypothetical protein
MRHKHYFYAFPTSDHVTSIVHPAAQSMASRSGNMASESLEEDNSSSQASSSSSSEILSPPPYHFPTPYEPESENAKTWAVDYEQSRMIHSPTSLSFLPYSDLDGNPLQVLPPRQDRLRKQSYSKSDSTSDFDDNEDHGMSATNGASDGAPRRRLPCYNQVADAYVFQQTIDERLRRIGVTQAREDNLRLAGVQWIDGVRRALRL